MIDTSNHGQVGKALYLKFTVDKFPYKTINNKPIEDGDIYNLENSSVPIHIDNTTKGDYECVCEFGTEVHIFQ